MAEEHRELPKAVGISRREFARRAALASAVAAVAPAAMATPEAAPNEHSPVVHVDGERRFSDTSRTVAPDQQPVDLPKLSPESHAEVDARVQTILGQYGGRFNDAQKAELGMRVRRGRYFRILALIPMFGLPPVAFLLAPSL